MKSLGDRMKDYEVRNRSYLQRRGYTVIRVDGKAFHTYTRGLEKPFDKGLVEDMQLTTKFLCEEIQGCKLGYTQSDEISLVLTDFDTHQTDAYFDGQIQKICSVVASMATYKFNELRIKRQSHFEQADYDYEVVAFDNFPRPAFFDARCFSVPTKAEAVNYLIWRQRDAVKNSISMVAQSLYSHKELHGMNGNQMQEMIWQKDQNWNEYPASEKRGTTVLKEGVLKETDDGEKFIRTEWKFKYPNFNDDPTVCGYEGPNVNDYIPNNE